MKSVEQDFISNKVLKLTLVAIITGVLVSDVVQMLSPMSAMDARVSVGAILHTTAMAMMSYLLAVGFYHTSNPKAYFVRLGVVALIAQPLYVIWAGMSWTFGNVLVSLALTLVVLCACFRQIALWQRVLLSVIPILLLNHTHKGLAVLVCTLAFYYGYVSYQRTGLSQKFRVLIPYALLSLGITVLTALKPYSLGAIFGMNSTTVWGLWLVLPFIYWHNGRQDLSPKMRYVFYGLYPVMLACGLGAKMIV